MVGFTCTRCGRFVLFKSNPQSQVLCDSCLGDVQHVPKTPADDGEGYCYADSLLPGDVLASMGHLVSGSFQPLQVRTTR